mgnify:CR=1 FL=1
MLSARSGDDTFETNISSEIIWPFHPERGQHKDGHIRTLTCSSCPVVRSDGMLIEYCSLPVRPRLSAFSPCLYCSGIRPIPTKLPVTNIHKGMNYQYQQE